MAQPPQPERPNDSGEEGVPLKEPPMDRFKDLTGRLLRVSREELKVQEDKHRTNKQRS